MYKIVFAIILGFLPSNFLSAANCTDPSGSTVSISTNCTKFRISEKLYLARNHIFFISSTLAPWLNWIEQPPPKGQVAGSNPAGVAIFEKNKYFTQWNS